MPPAQEDAWRLAGQEISGKLQFESEVYDCLVPASAVVSQSDGQYIYIVRRVQGVWGDELEVYPQKVTVATFNEKYAALKEPLPGGTQLADKWDRPLSGGMRVVKSL